MHVNMIVQVVKHFMDFGTIQKKLTDQARADKYVSPEDFVSDVRQVFRNCYLYNKNTTHVWHAAKVLSEKFEREIKKLQGYVGI